MRINTFVRKKKFPCNIQEKVQKFIIEQNISSFPMEPTWVCLPWTIMVLIKPIARKGGQKVSFMDLA